MSARELIDQYQMTVANEEAARVQEREDAVLKLRTLFEANCHAWLGDLWGDFKVKPIQFTELQSWPHGTAHFSLPLSFMGVNGEINQDFYLNSMKPTGSGNLDFGQLHIGNRGPWAHITLPCDINGAAQSPNQRDLAGLLALVESYVPHQAERERVLREERKDDFMNYGYMSTQRVQEKLARAIAEFPELADQFRTKAQEALNDMAETARKQAEEVAKRAVVEEECAKLRELAALAWKSPFTLYLITYGAYLNGEDGEAYSRSIYCLKETPEADGYYLAYEGSDLKRRVKPTHILSVEKVTISSESDCPYEVKRYITVHSKRVRDASVYVSLPPLDFYALDTDVVGDEVIRML